VRTKTFASRGRNLLLTFCVALTFSPFPFTQATAAQEGWTVTHDIQLVSRWPVAGKVRQETVTADLYRPVGPGPFAAAVIINSSGGVLAHVEPFYARLLASHGVASLVVDSFTPRGIRSTEKDQGQLAQSWSDEDAAAGFRWLAQRDFIDRSRIFVLGMSKGGITAVRTSMLMDRRRLRIEDVRFAAHVAIAACGGDQPADVRTTGAPIFFMIAELDDYTPAQKCLDLIGRMRTAAVKNVRFAVYPGVYHAYESTSGLRRIEVERGYGCDFVHDEQFNVTDRRTGKSVRGDLREYLLKTCIDIGPVTVGGDPRVKAQAVADLLQFLRDAEVIADAEARAVVPDCRAFSQEGLRDNCLRARAGWTGDVVALARAFRYADGPRRDDALAALLFRLAADRGHPAAQWELSLMHRDGAGVPQDLAAALSLARASAETGEAPAFNIMGVLARDGVGRPRDDADAVRWFQRAADVRHGYGLANLGRMYWQGRGGLAENHTEAVRLWRLAAHQENPWGRLFLAEALEKGDGTDRDLSEARRLLQAVAVQDVDGEAKERATEALSRLGR
jgi:dienelactone hydrolase